MVNWDSEITSVTRSMFLCCAVVVWVLIFIAYCGLPSWCQYHQDPLRGVVRGREKNSVAMMGVFPCVGLCRCISVTDLGIVLWCRKRFRWSDSRKCGVTDSFVSLLLCGGRKWFPMSEKGVTIGRMFLYVVSTERTSYYRCRWSLFYVLKDTLMEI